MKFRLPALAAPAICCLGCVSINSELGGSLVPIDQQYTIHLSSLDFSDSHPIEMQMTDSLSGYSSTRITIGAIRDDDYGLTTRSCALTLVPMYDTLDFGTNPSVTRFHLSVAADTVSVLYDRHRHILQNVGVYELSSALDPAKNFDCNATVEHGSKRISKGTPVINGSDSLSFDFTQEFADRFLGITQEDLEDMDTYLEKFPGIYLDTDEPVGNGGRISMFDLQLDYDSDYYVLMGNYATLNVNSTWEGTRKDSSFFFYLSALDFYQIDSLLTNSSTGSFPQYCLNLTGHETRSRAGKATDRVNFEGGGGLKPMVRARTLYDMAAEMISAQGADPRNVIINKASIVMPFDFPDDYTAMEKFPIMLSPTCRIKNDTLATFMGLTDSSSSSEDQGDINRSLLQYAPDITYHLQEILKMDDEKIDSGNYDVWMLLMAEETTTTSSSSSSSDLSEYYQYLAYQSYYNSMYGGYGYGSYSGYGYGSSSSYYSNYYSYMMMMMYANSSSSTTTTSTQLDKDRYYYGWLNGPEAASGRVPRLEITFSVPND